MRGRELRSGGLADGAPALPGTGAVSQSAVMGPPFAPFGPIGAAVVAAAALVALGLWARRRRAA